MVFTLSLRLKQRLVLDKANALDGGKEYLGRGYS